MDRTEYQKIYQQCWRAANPDYSRLYGAWWRAENNNRPKNYTKMHNIYIALSEEEKLRIPFNAWYEAYKEQMGPTKTRSQVQVKVKEPKEPKERLPQAPRKQRPKMTDIEKKRRKIELDLAKIDARRKAWRDINNVV